MNILITIMLLIGFVSITLICFRYIKKRVAKKKDYWYEKGRNDGWSLGWEDHKKRS